MHDLHAWRDDAPLTYVQFSCSRAGLHPPCSVARKTRTSASIYRQVIGWSVQDVDRETASERSADYNMCCDAGDPMAGICHARGENVDLPPVWMLYLPVGDLAESLRRVPEEEGKIIKATRGTDGEYGFAAVQDPVGACLALVPG